MSRIFSWTLNVVYLVMLLLASPWILWSAFKHGKYREGFGEKLLGRVPERQGDGPCLWFHAVSVGEVNLLATVLDQLARTQGSGALLLASPPSTGERDYQIFISTTTKAGYELAKKKYAAAYRVLLPAGSELGDARSHAACAAGSVGAG